MKRYLTIILGCLAMVSTGCITSCGYKVGGSKPAVMKGLNSFNVEMFQNFTTQPMLSMQFTTALANALQADGMYRMASPANSDFAIRGAVKSLNPFSLSTDWRDSYLSSEIGVRISVTYEVVNKKTGQVVYSGTVEADGSYYNNGSINMQVARDNAMSYAARVAAEQIVTELTIG